VGGVGGGGLDWTEDDTVKTTANDISNIVSFGCGPVILMLPSIQMSDMSDLSLCQYYDTILWRRVRFGVFFFDKLYET